MAATTYQAAHRFRVMKLYRNAIKLTHDWCIDRIVLSQEVIELRKQFDSHKNETNIKVAEQLVADGEAKLLQKIHPDPYRLPYLPGGSKYQRNVPPPTEFLTNPYVHH
uniref:NADH dehydrogenase [ubiquinone] 1 beta subcomplex subunit 9 n=1 Tax=Cryptomonas curvata TaxID=233186 RepID=A0A7S0N7F7_9CRYP|mmetsp:Transcript_8557/g.18418  ORF Transcript_8557/g.18418 Transcript_8557/m.18418 type:complete len:108 (+) Transcript_8557:144-467(+)